MPRAPAPPWAQRREPILDHLVHASIDQAKGKYDPQTGHYATLVYRGCETRERAEEIKRALHRCSLYLTRKGIVSVGMYSKILRDGNGWKVEFAAVDKVMARKYVLSKYGPDRSKWPYSPRRGSANYG